MKIHALLLAAAITTATAAQASPNLVQNPGFEAGTFHDTSGGLGYEQLTTPCCDLANWTVGNSLAWGVMPTDINVHGGVAYVDLTGIGSNFPNYGSVSQTLSTVAGQTYAFSVFTTRDGAAGISVLAAGNAVTLSGTYGAYNVLNTTWGQLTGTFKATGASTLLQILGSGATQNFVIGLDDVSVTASVPEPATWAMMLAGFGLAGLALRRRALKPATPAV